MSEQSLEALFLQRLAEIELPPHSITRSESGQLLLDIPSPCEDVGFLRATIVAANEITVYSKVFHSHCVCHSPLPPSVFDSKIADEAVDQIQGFLSGRLCASVENGYDGRVASYGFGPLASIGKTNPSYAKLIHKLHGGPSSYRAWSWEGEIPVGSN
ncbi:hypothetical protein IB232_09045 [Pseudomonas sp. PDM15]|uniref:hypothetical protein n=1 Tax=Pseudomonas sp. PDM15 TaxID=2769303 RepID=UPI00177FE4B6|nr:hypothetical protein [Pseudomonas sp. PDM15]MBD9425462.1 hypothetical protein [Pseudomonas sp. PDM15]